MYTRSRELGMRALVEVHDKSDVEKVRKFKPGLVGINSRDLKTFLIDLLHPLQIKKIIDWNPEIILESGVKGTYGGRFAGSENFAGILVGESVMRDPDSIPKILFGLNRPAENNFWSKLAGKLGAKKPPLVKVCGLTVDEDVSAAEDLGADILGFVIAPSPRRAAGSFIRALPAGKALKAAVTVCRDGKPDREALSLLKEGYVDCLQIHGEFDADVSDIYPYYASIQVKKRSDSIIPPGYEPPRLLFDTYSPDKAGGTGKRIPADLLEDGAGERLWIAGGINHTNVEEIIRKYRPELIDASSGLESEPGKKDFRKMEKFFDSIRRCR
jgi:indole-3-glycerol phosphate synthase/phosphoribosylanthranilate isomerase